MKIKRLLLCFSIFLININSYACDAYSSLCFSGTLVANEKILVGTISNAAANNVQLNIIDVLFGVENNNMITIWNGSTIECNGPWPNNATDMGNIGDTILCMIEPITSIENTWDVIGEYRRPSILAGDTYTNFSLGALYEGTYNYNEVLTIDFGNHCCNSLSEYFYADIYDLPTTTSSSSPIPLTAFPQGGTFSGTGIVFNAFNPSIAGPGNHTITYTINEEFGCSFSTQQDIFVFTINFNFVNYNLGTVSPRISDEINIQLAAPESGQYSFKIFDFVGEQILNEKKHFEAGIHLQNISLQQNLPKGVYMLNISNSHSKVTKKFLVGE